MSIDLDTRAAIRHPDLVRLVRAVVTADNHDEADWIEWKCGLDLGVKKGCFPVAKTVLGMANRMPANASLTCEGLGYIVVGAEPGSLAGVISVDPADLDQMLEPWLGGVEGPRYTPTYVVVGDKKVLVVVIEAPKNGDPIYTLRKEFDGARDGDVFVRKSGRTERAKSVDIKALQDRAAAAQAATPELEVSLVGDVPLSWFNAAGVDSVVAGWLASRQGAMESAAHAEERRRHPKSNPIDVTSIMDGDAEHREELARIGRDVKRMAFLAGLAKPDTRKLEEYLVEVEAWGGRVTKDAPVVLLERYLRARHGLVALRVHNPTGRYLPKVMVEVHFEWDRLSSPGWHYDDFDETSLPAEPRPYGEPTPSPLAQSFAITPFLPSSVISSLGSNRLPPRSWVEKGSVRIVFDVGDLRQEDTDTSDEHYLFLPERPADGVLRGAWKATVPEVHGVIRGILDVPVRKDPVELRDLLDNDRDHEHDDED